MDELFWGNGNKIFLSRGGWGKMYLLTLKEEKPQNES